MRWKKCPETKIAQALDNKNNIDKTFMKKLDENNYFIDRDPRLFSYVFQCFVDEDVVVYNENLPNEVFVGRLLDEYEFFKIPSFRYHVIRKDTTS